MLPKALFFFTILLLSEMPLGHAAEIDPKKLKSPQTSMSFNLDSAYTYTVIFKGVPLTYTVPSGKYTAELEGENGLFLRCSTLCVEVTTSPPRRPPIVEHVEGGIFLTNHGAKIYFYRDNGGVKDYGLGYVVNKIIEAGDGHILFPRKQELDMQLASRVRPMNAIP